MSCKGKYRKLRPGPQFHREQAYTELCTYLGKQFEILAYEGEGKRAQQMRRETAAALKKCY